MGIQEFRLKLISVLARALELSGNPASCFQMIVVYSIL